MNEALNNLLTRRSCRAYEKRRIQSEELDAIRRVERLNGMALGNPDNHPFYGAPTLIVVLGHSESPLGLADASLVIGNLPNAANAVGNVIFQHHFHPREQPLFAGPWLF